LLLGGDVAHGNGRRNLDCEVLVEELVDA
jgi:hypothetical protein